MSKIFSPKDEKELSEIIKQCHAQKTSLRITGSGTRLNIGNVIKTDAFITTKKLSGISLYEPGALTLVVKAGTKYKDVKKVLDSEGQRLAFEPIDHRAIFSTIGEPTIGAIAAGNFSGPRRIQAGACRDALIGVRFVEGSGQIIKNGGRVMKNVTGLDLVKLMAGSFGTLGVLSELSFKTLPKPERAASLLIEGLSTIDAVKIMSKALGSPYEVSGASHCQTEKGESRTLLRIEGFDSQVSYRLEKIKQTIIKPFNCEIIEGAKHDKTWRFVRNVERFKDSNKPLWRIVSKPSNAPKIEEQLNDKTGAKTSFDWGGGLIWAQMEDENNAHQDAVRHIVNSLGGYATLIRAKDEVRKNIATFHPQDKIITQLSACIKQKFDPNNILNPGLMVKGG